MGNFEKGNSRTYSFKAKENGVYVFVLKGEVTIEGQKLSNRDGFGIWETDKISIKADADAKVLIMDVPMRT